MPVYVDSMKAPYGRMLMSHMVADTLEELHAIARKIGLKRVWFQDGLYPHYDVSQTVRAMAIELGAIEVSSREIVRIVQKPEMDKFIRERRVVDIPMADEDMGKEA